MSLFQIETLAVLFSLVSVILTVKKNVWCWPIGIIGVIFYMILFSKSGIWGNMILQLVFILQSILGWYNWNTPSKYSIKWMNRSSSTITTTIVVLLSISTSIFLREKGAIHPYFDGVTTSLSIVAMLLMAYKKIESWIIWIIVDIIFILFFYTTGFYLSCGIYSIFLILAILGLLEWRKSIKVD